MIDYWVIYIYNLMKQPDILEMEHAIGYSGKV